MLLPLVRRKRLDRCATTMTGLAPLLPLTCTHCRLIRAALIRSGKCARCVDLSGLWLAHRPRMFIVASPPPKNVSRLMFGAFLSTARQFQRRVSRCRLVTGHHLPSNNTGQSSPLPTVPASEDAIETALRPFCTLPLLSIAGPSSRIP